jgi:putative spermidine/putrescine transport system ATP-binding protein
MFKNLRLQGVTRSFGTHAALSSLDLSVEAGSFIALLGPSGCGKSTALNCIAGLLPLTKGEIWLDDRRIDTLPPERRGFGMVFQNYALFPHMAVSKNVGYGLAMRGVPSRERSRRVERALDLVRLGNQAGKLPGQLSGGQQQRVAIARAIVIEPPLVLMDEPLSNLDAKLRLEMRNEIRKLHTSLGLTTIYVTHDQDEALSMADRIVVMRDGAVQQVGTPQDLYERPASLDVARFMGYQNTIAVEVIGGPDEAGAVELRSGSVVIYGTPAGPVSGRQQIATFRPDDVVLNPNGFPARVETAQYSGREYTTELRLPTGDLIAARLQLDVRAGDEVRLSIPADRVLVYPAPPAAGVH